MQCALFRMYVCMCDGRFMYVKKNTMFPKTPFVLCSFPLSCVCCTQGLTTIRALRKQQRFVQHTHSLMDNSARAWWPCQCVNRWLSVRLELVGLAVVFGSALFVSVVQRRSAGLAGLAITSALNLTGLMNWCEARGSDTNNVKRLLHC